MQSPSLRWSVGVGVGLTAVGLSLWTWRRRCQALLWEEVGRVEDLMIYPIKSGGGYKVETATTTRYGLVVDGVVDRSFVVMLDGGANPNYVSSGMAPALCTLLPSLQGGQLTLTPLSGPPFSVDIARAMQEPPKDFALKGDAVRGWDCGDGVAAWLREKLFGESAEESRPRVRLMYVGDAEQLHRPATKPPFFHFPQYKKEDEQVFHDKCAFLLTGTSSLVDLNSRLEKPVEMIQLRPNIVVTGSDAFAEDEWAYVRIGQDVRLRTLKPRDACTKINVVPSTGKRQNEVFDMLKKYRILPMPEELAKHWSSKPFFGLHMALDSGGQINVGDKVFAVRRKPQWLL